WATDALNWASGTGPGRPGWARAETARAAATSVRVRVPRSRMAGTSFEGILAGRDRGDMVQDPVSPLPSQTRVAAKRGHCREGREVIGAGRGGDTGCQRSGGRSNGRSLKCSGGGGAEAGGGASGSWSRKAT